MKKKQLLNKTLESHEGNNLSYFVICLNNLQVYRRQIKSVNHI